MHPARTEGTNDGVDTEITWQRSSRCASNTCVEVAPVEGGVLIRDSKHPDQEPLAIGTADWADFVIGVLAGEYDDLR